MRRRLVSRSLFCLCVTSSPAIAQVKPDSALLAAIMSIRAIDDHAHPATVHRKSESDEFDAPPSVPPLGPPVLLRAGNPAWSAADRDLFGSGKEAAVAQRRDEYPSFILDKIGIEVMLANRHSLGPGLSAPRFRLVWFADPFVFPLDNILGKSLNPQKRDEFESAEQWLARYIAESGLSRKPATLDDYLNKLVVPLLEKKKREGAVGIKFALAYLRDLRVSNPSRNDATRIFAKYSRGGTPEPAEYRTLQDYVIRSIVREAGRIGLPVQIHVGAGSGPFFDNAGADPMLLMPLLLDPALRQTTFVLVHGGYPAAADARVIFAKPNVYVDFSSQAFLSSTRELSDVLRKWLEFRPEKVLFGTDAYSVSPAVGWEELAWMTNNSSRRALAIALTGMMEDGEIDRARALQIANMVMRETAITVYGLK